MEKLLKEEGLESCNALNTPGIKEPTSPEKSWFEGEAIPQEGSEADASGAAPAGGGI